MSASEDDREPDREPDQERGQSDLEPHEVHDAVGGLAAFRALVASFYAKVERDPLLRPIYPDDLEPGKEHLARFLAQYWGGGPIYSAQRGHPRLRMRHAPFPITTEAAMRWAQLMSAAIHEQDHWPQAARDHLLDYVTRATPTMVNQLPEDVTTLPHRQPPPSAGHDPGHRPDHRHGHGPGHQH